MKGRGFQLRSRQTGWIGIAAAVVGGIASSASQQSAQSKQFKLQYQDQSQLSALNFEQQAWLAQEGEKWTRQDIATAHNYNKGLIAGFDNASGTNKAMPDGSWPTIAPATADTTGLAQTDANGNPLIYDPRTGAPMFGNAKVPPLNPQIQPTPPAGAPMTQFAGAA